MSSITKIFKNVHLIWTNFSGTPNDYNNPIGTDAHGKPIGKRSFNIVLTEEMADELRNLELVGDSGKLIKGCNIKTRLPSNGDGDPLYTLKVNFGKYAPEAIWRVIPRGRMALNLETVGNLDHEIIDHADLKVIFTTYEKGPNVGITAYLQKLIAYVREDELDSDEEFNSIPIIGGPDVDEEELPF